MFDFDEEEALARVMACLEAACAEARRRLQKSPDAGQRLTREELTRMEAAIAQLLSASVDNLQS